MDVQMKKRAPDWDAADLIPISGAISHLFHFGLNILICKMKVLDQIISAVTSMISISSKTVFIIMLIHTHKYIFVYEIIRFKKVVYK